MAEKSYENEKLFVLIMRASVNGRASTIIDTFSGWLIGGFGVAATLFITDTKSVQEHVTVCGIQWFLYLFLVALLLAVIQKILAVMVGSNSMGGLAGYELAKEFNQNGVKLDQDFIFTETEKGMLPFARWYASKIFKEAKYGNILASSRNFTKLCQVQGVLTLLQAIITFSAISIIAFTFHA